MCELGCRRLSERDDAAALWIEARQHVPDRPVLDGGVHPLQDEERSARALGEEPVVEDAQPLDHLREALHAFFLAPPEP